VCDGELLYSKPDDQDNALNIIPLNSAVTAVKKVDTNIFTITLLGSKRVFRFELRVYSECDSLVSPFSFIHSQNLS
jgi:hypothetical protein